MNSNNFEKKKLKVLNLFKEKKFEDVFKYGLKLIKKDPSDTQLIYIIGLSYINKQNFIEAENYFKKLLSLKKTPELFYTYGNIQKKLKKYNNAISSFEQSINLNPNFSEAHNNLGNTKKLINRREEAIKHYRQAINLKKNNIEALFNLSIILKENNNFEELIEVYGKILKIDINNIKTIYNLGSAYLFLGNISKGREYFENAIEIDDLHIPSYRNYISITKIESKNKIFNKLKNIDLSLLNNENKILISNALSKAYFDIKDIKKGFYHLNNSNFLKKDTSKFSMEKEFNQFEKIKSFFNNVYDKNFNFKDNLKIKPIFIVGMPRSGTSLIEQILSSHSKIYGAGELNFMQKIIDKLGLESSEDLMDYFSEIRNFYHKSIVRISQNEMIIDKLPLNFRWIGFIIKSLPEAKIIHIERNPMAVCWSNYKTHFVDSGMDFNLSQKDIANYYYMYSDLMKFWQKKFSNNILNIKYETFVQDFETNTKKIMDYLNLKWEHQMKDYQSIKRSVTTASYLQVREKIKKNTSEDWRKYHDYLETMKNTLESKNIDF